MLKKIFQKIESWINTVIPRIEIKITYRRYRTTASLTYDTKKGNKKGSIELRAIIESDRKITETEVERIFEDLVKIGNVKLNQATKKAVELNKKITKKQTTEKANLWILRVIRFGSIVYTEKRDL